jgi:hypothetical protein
MSAIARIRRCATWSLGVLRCPSIPRPTRLRRRPASPVTRGRRSAFALPAHRRRYLFFISIDHSPNQMGLTAAETLVVLGLAAVLVLVSVPALDRARHSAAMRSTAQQVSGLLVRSRIHAIRNRRSTGLVFERDARGWRCFVAADGDGDGIRRADIVAGGDPIVDGPCRLRSAPGGLGILQGTPVRDPSGSGLLGGDPHDPVRAGRGDIITFTPTGTATPSSVYFTDHHEAMLALRVVGTTGRVRTMVWHSGWPRWKQGWY